MSGDAEQRDDTPAAIWARWSHLWAPWEDLVDANAPTVLDQAGELAEEEWVEPVWHFLTRHYEDLVVEPAEQDLVYERDASERLIDQVRTLVPAQESYNACRRVLEVLDAGNRLGRWCVAIPHVPAPLPPPPASYFQHERFVELTRYQDLFDVFASSLGQDPAALTARGRWGRVLGAAVLFGGLLQPKWLEAVPEAMKNASPGMEALELYTTRAGRTAKYHWRWYPDPITRLLLMDAHGDSFSQPPPLSQGRQVFALVKQFAKEIDFAEQVPPNWSSLRSVVATRLALYVPSYVVAYLNGQLASASAPSHALERLTNTPETPPPVKKPPSGSPTNGDYAQTNVEERDAPVPAQVKSLARAIRANPSKGSAPRIAQWREHWQQAGQGEALLASVQRLAEWVEWLFSGRHAHSPVSPNTAYDRYNAIAERLVGQLGTRDPAQFDAEVDYFDLYTTAIEDAQAEGDPARVRRGLHSFHTFLTQTHPCVPDLLESDLFAGRGGGHRPDPNLVGYGTYVAATNLIRRNHTTSDETAMVMTMLVELGLFGGLRRGEAGALRICDVEPEPDFNIVVRPTDRRGVKTHAGVRVVPFGLLAPHNAKKNLQTLYEHRLACSDVPGPRSKAELFRLPNRGPIRNNDQILEDVTSVLAAATNDATVRFHHLRHTFASALLLQLWQAEHGRESNADTGVASLGRLLGQDLHSSEASRVLREKLVADAGTQRRSLRAISLMLGHSGVSVSFEHYIHVTDYIAGAELAAAVAPLSVAQISRLTGYSVSRVYAVQAQSTSKTTGSLLHELTKRKARQKERASAPRVETETGSRDPESQVPNVDRAEELGRAINAYHAARVAGEIRHGIDGRDLAPLAMEVGSWPQRMRKRVNAQSARCLDIPRGEGEWALAKTAMAYVVGLPRREREVLFAYLRKKQVGGQPMALRFHRLPELKRWMRFLEGVGALGAMQLAHRPLHSSKAGSARTQRAYWEKVTGIEARASDREPSVRASRGEVVIEPRKDFSKMMGGVAYAVQWGLVITYVLFSFEDKRDP